MYNIYVTYNCKPRFFDGVNVKLKLKLLFWRYEMEIIISKNQIVKITRNYVYFFNAEGILCKIPSEAEERETKDFSFINNISLHSFNYVKRAICCLETGDTLEKFEADIKRFKAIYEKRKKDSIHNVIFKRVGIWYYFFNSKGVYSSIYCDDVLNSNLYYFPKSMDFVHITSYFLDMSNNVANALHLNNYNTFKKAINLLEVGQTTNDLIKIYNSVKLEDNHWNNDLERFITTIEKPDYVCIPENPNKDTSFDYVYVNVNVVSRWDTDRAEYIKKNSKEISKKALERIETDRKFKKYGIPINFLKLSKAIFSANLSLIQFLFELRDIEN